MSFTSHTALADEDLTRPWSVVSMDLTTMDGRRS